MYMIKISTYTLNILEHIRVLSENSNTTELNQFFHPDQLIHDEICKNIDSSTFKACPVLLWAKSSST